MLLCLRVRSFERCLPTFVMHEHFLSQRSLYVCIGNKFRVCIGNKLKKHEEIFLAPSTIVMHEHFLSQTQFVFERDLSLGLRDKIENYQIRYFSNAKIWFQIRYQISDIRYISSSGWSILGFAQILLFSRRYRYFVPKDKIYLISQPYLSSISRPALS